jgi:hypothetical protein
LTILTLRPNADISTEFLMQPVGSQYANVDEGTLDESDYNYNNVNNTLLDLLGLPNHSSESGDINSVKVYAVCRLADVGSPPSHGSARLAVKIGGTTYYGSSFVPSHSTATLYSATWATNPNTSAVWSWTNIDDLVAGIEGTAVYDIKAPYGCYVYYYQLYVEVDYVGSWANIKNIRMGTGSVSPADLEKIWFGTTEVAVADIAEFNGVAV